MTPQTACLDSQLGASSGLRRVSRFKLDEIFPSSLDD